MRLLDRIFNLIGSIGNLCGIVFLGIIAIREQDLYRSAVLMAGFLILVVLTRILQTVQSWEEDDEEARR